jgi:hypothetical protein
MDSQVQVHYAGCEGAALLIVSILQVIVFGFLGPVADILGDASVPEIQKNALDKDSWIALLAQDLTMLTVMVSMAVGCALGVYTGVLGRKGNSHHEGIQPVVRSLAAFLKHVATPPTMICVSPCGTESFGVLERIDVSWTCSTNSSLCT